jgi:hypothetical protein
MKSPLRLLVYCALNPWQRFPKAEQSILALQGVAQTVFDGSDDPALDAYPRILRKYQGARRMLLAGDYDALLTVESDMVVPPDAALKLAQAEADVAYGVYCWRHGWPWWSAYPVLKAEIGVSLSLAPDQARAWWGQTIEVRGVGFGCTLIHRRVLEAIDFRLPDGDAFADWSFGLDAHAHGFKQVSDLSVVCGHITPEGETLYPDPTQADLCRIEL